MTSRPSRIPLATVGVVAALLDLATKEWAFGAIPLLSSLEVLGEFLVFQPHWNSAGPWSWGQGWGWLKWGLPVISVVAVIVIGRLWLETPPGDRLKGLGLVLILGGALGNLHDRARTLIDPAAYHGVRDFILFPSIVFGDPFPNFNLADAWITIGVVFVGWRILFEGRAPSPEPDAASATAAAGDRP